MVTVTSLVFLSCRLLVECIQVNNNNNNIARWSLPSKPNWYVRKYGKSRRAGVKASNKLILGLILICRCTVNWATNQLGDKDWSTGRQSHNQPITYNS